MSTLQFLEGTERLFREPSWLDVLGPFPRGPWVNWLYAHPEYGEELMERMERVNNAGDAANFDLRGYFFPMQNLQHPGNFSRALAWEKVAKKEMIDVLALYPKEQKSLFLFDEYFSKDMFTFLEFAECERKVLQRQSQKKVSSNEFMKAARSSTALPYWALREMSDRLIVRTGYDPVYKFWREVTEVCLAWSQNDPVRRQALVPLHARLGVVHDLMMRIFYLRMVEFVMELHVPNVFYFFREQTSHDAWMRLVTEVEGRDMQQKNI